MTVGKTHSSGKYEADCEDPRRQSYWQRIESGLNGEKSGSGYYSSGKREEATYKQTLTTTGTEWHVTVTQQGLYQGIERLPVCSR